MQEICADQLALCLGKLCMGFQTILHVSGTGLKSLQKIAVASQKIRKYVSQLRRRHRVIERQNPVDDVVCPRFIRWVEISRFRRRFEWPYNDTRGIGSQA